jgi:hypothetical protein
MAWELDNLTNPFGYKKGAQKPVNNMSGLLDFAMQANQYIPVSGDIQSGILAANDVAQGNYANAALNAAGLLPFVPSLGAATKNINNIDESLPILKSLNPTGGLYVDYTPEIRANQPIGGTLVSIDKTMGGSPDDLITIYRGAPKKQKKIVPGDFITDMQELAKAYTGDGNVLSMKVRKGDILDDIEEGLGNEYIYRPFADKLIKK